MVELETTAVQGQTYTLTEVSQYLNVNESTLRNWEKRFGEFLSNYRNQYNHRLFTQDDVQILERAKYLIDSGMFTISGVKHMLANGNVMTPQAQTVPEPVPQQNPFDEEYKQKLLYALNSLGSEVHSLRREVREDLRGSIKAELDHLRLLLFPPQEEKRPWWKLF